MSMFVLKGCATRCKDVYSILWSLGGRGDCCGIYPFFYYYILPNGNIIGTKNILDKSWAVFTLEEFEKTYPYKVGDKVIYKNTVYVIIGMDWDGDEICYRIDYGCGYPSSGIKVGELQPYKEKEGTMEKNEHLILDCVSTDKGHELVPHEDYEIKQEGGKYYLVKKKTQYPKTYKECCEVLGMQSNLFLHLSSMNIDGEVEEKSYGYKIASQMNCLYELLVCRDAYWKIAGDWKPSDCQIVYGISRSCDKIEKVDELFGGEMVLEFPSREMRDSFYKNFYDLINKCKDLYKGGTTMIGKPKFKEGDVVTFTLGEKEITGKVFVVDKWGIWMDHSDVYYDIMDEKANMLYKHVEEKRLKKEKL